MKAFLLLASLVAMAADAQCVDGLLSTACAIDYDFASGAHNKPSVQFLAAPTDAFGVRFVADVPRDVGLSVVFTDSDGQSHVRHIRTAVGGPEAYTALFAAGHGPHWGGKDDGKVRPPVKRLEFHVENRLKNIPGGTKGRVSVSDVALFDDREKNEGAFDEAGFEAVRREAAALRQSLPPDRAKGAAALSVADDFFGWIREDLSHGLTNRAMRELRELRRLVRNEAARQKRVDGGAEKDFPAAPAKAFDIGYGHFDQAVAGMERMLPLGMDIIQIEVGPWHVFPEEGVVNTNALDRFYRAADKAERLGMKICLLVSPHYFPEWLLAKHPEVKPCGDGMMHYCVYSPVVRDLLKRYFEFVIPRVRGRKALHSICLSNEPVMSAWDEKCALQGELAGWLKGRYAGIGELNAKWRTSYASFEDVRLPKNFYAFKPRSPEALELTRFNRERFAAFHGWMADVIHGLAPEIPLHAKIMIHANFNYGTSFYCVDPELFAPFSGFGGNDCSSYPTPESPVWAHEFARMEAGYDYQRSVSRAPVFNTENHIIDDRERRPVAPEHCYATLWQNAIHGQEATTIWLWERVFDKERMHDPNGLFLERPECLAATGFAALDLNRLARPVRAIAARKPTVLLHWSLSSLVLDNRDGGAFLDAYRAASCLGQPLGVATEKMLSDFAADGKRTGALEDVRAVLLPDASHLPDGVRAGLRRLEADGVCVVAAGLRPDKNDFLEPRNGGDFRFLGDLRGEALAQVLFDEAARWNLPRYPRAIAPFGGVAYGVESHGVELDGARYLSIVNHRKTPQTVRLPSAGEDLISGRSTKSVLELPPLMPMLVKMSACEAPSAGLSAQLAEAHRLCAALGDDVARLERQGKGQYSRLSYEVARWSLACMEDEELPRGYTARVGREVRELMSVLRPACERARRILSGEEADVAVPRFKSGGSVREDGALVRGDRVWPDGRVERDMPLIWTGWGHFERAQQGRELAALNRMGFNFLQMETGLYKFLPRSGYTNEQAVAEFTAAADRAYAADTRVDFLLSPHYVPGWVSSLVPKDNGVCKNGFIKCCIHCPAVSDAMARHCAVAAGAAKGHPALHAFCLTNEPHSGGIQGCREVRRLWAEHLKAKFGSVDAMNEAWKTAYGRFEDVELQTFPDLAATPAALEYVRFDRALSTAFHAKLLAAAKAAAPGKPFHSKVVANEEFLGRKFSTFWSIDLRAFARMFDWLDNDALCFHLDNPKARYAARWQENEGAYDFLRSFAVKPTVNSENHDIVDKCMGEVPPEHVYAALWQNAVHGQTATALWCWERGLSDESIMIGLAPEHPNCLEALGRCSLDLQRLSAELAPIQAQRPTVLVLRSLASAVLNAENEGRATLSAYAAASFLGETVGFLTDDALADYAEDGVRLPPLDTGRVILLPSVTHLPRQAIVALRKLEAEGVRILAFGEPFRADDCNRPIKASTPWPCVAGADDPEIFGALAARMPDFGFDGKPRLAKPVFGVETHGYERDGVRRLALCNQLRVPVTVELEAEGTDLITGERTGRSLTLQSRKPLFVEFDK